MRPEDTANRGRVTATQILLSGAGLSLSPRATATLTDVSQQLSCNLLIQLEVGVIPKYGVHRPSSMRFTECLVWSHVACSVFWWHFSAHLYFL